MVVKEPAAIALPFTFVSPTLPLAPLAAGAALRAD